MPRTLLLFDPDATPSSWNERMAPGEYAVHSTFLPTGTAPACEVLSSLPEAETHARHLTALHPESRCRIYDHQGFIGAPLREFQGSAYKPSGELSHRFLRWGGSVLFFGGLLLLGVDMRSGFKLQWPGVVGARMIVPGLLFLVIEAVLLLLAGKEARREARKESRPTPANPD